MSSANILSAMLLLACSAQMLWIASSQVSPKDLKELDVNQIVVRDRDGKVRVLIGTDGPSARPGVFLFNGKDRKIAELIVEHDDMPSLIMGAGTDESPFSDRIAMEVRSDNQARLTFYGPTIEKPGNERLAIIGTLPSGWQWNFGGERKVNNTQGGLHIWDTTGTTTLQSK